ncbi:MAG: hypothetical protein KGH57_03490 [Candidatus Micrarchaeota archaeon]|nr:hypothetical protein [Candidatus Micrarchaeota archaeon]
MYLQKMHLLVLSLFFLTIMFRVGTASASQTCTVTLSASNQTYNLTGNSCSSVSVAFSPSVSNSGVNCKGAAIGSGSSITVNSNDRSVYLRNCTVNNPSIALAPHSSLYIMGDDNPAFSPAFADNTSNVTVMHYLRVNVFMPFGYNTSAFGPRAAGFSYIFPLFNHTFRYNNTELQMSEFFDSRFTNNFSFIAESVPMGAYNITQSDIETNYSAVSYGQIKGYRVFPVSDYTLSKNGVVRYNPYQIDYSFLAYDQLVMYTLNITRNVNLTPMYIQPIYPPFNFQILPDNFTSAIQIRYVVAVPPQDGNWNFTDYLYRYDPSEFSTNPVSGGVGSHSILYKAFAHPGTAPNYTANGTGFYFINYTASVALGINSSIMTAQGYIPGLGSFVQDSTTPSFSFGLGYCALAYNLSIPMSAIMVYRSGTYDMAGGTLLPIAAPATPQLVQRPCSVGVVVRGSNININCNGGTINDTVVGIDVMNSSNIGISDCKVEGNGISVENSQGVTFRNLTLQPSGVRDFGVNISDASGVGFYNLNIGNGYSSDFSVFSSSGTPFSEGIEVYNVSVCGQANITAIRQFAFIYSSRDTCASLVSSALSGSINPLYELAALSLALVAVYAYIFLRFGRGHEARGARLRGRGRSK